MGNIANYLTPETLEFINYFNDFDVKKLTVHSYECNKKFLIYFLYKNNKLIYIGKTTNLENRLLDHKKTKDFDSYSVLDVSEEEYDIAERVLINKYLPPLNNDSLTKKMKQR